MLTHRPAALLTACGDDGREIADASQTVPTLSTPGTPATDTDGHDCTRVPANITACDHLEESMFPIEALAKQSALSSLTWATRTARPTSM